MTLPAGARAAWGSLAPPGASSIAACTLATTRRASLSVSGPSGGQLHCGSGGGSVIGSPKRVSGSPRGQIYCGSTSVEQTPTEYTLVFGPFGGTHHCGGEVHTRDCGGAETLRHPGGSTTGGV